MAPETVVRRMPARKNRRLQHGLSEVDVRDQLDRIAGSAIFKRSERLSRFLDYVVNRALRDAGTVREVEIALDVFDKGGGFDSRTDPIVRVEARRLRKTLSAYYETVGAADPISIALPTRGYTPKFQLRGNKRPAPMPPARNAEIRTSAGGPSVAVLPFLNMTNEDAQDVFCQGVTEELINALTHVDDLKVASRTSAFQFKGMAVDLRTVGKDLGVQTVVEGSIRLDGDRLRITAQLSSAADGFHLWSETFDATMSDPFQVQESLAREMASRIADQLHAS